MKRFVRRMAAVLSAAAVILLGAGFAAARELPDSFSVPEGETFRFSRGIPISASSEGVMAAQAGATTGVQYKSDLRLFGLVEVKSVNVSVVAPTYVIPGGETFGIKLYTEGVMVIGMSDVDTPDGPRNPAQEAGIRKGDILLAINGTPVNTNSDVSDLFRSSGGNPLSISVRRGSATFTATVRPALSSGEKTYKAGLWVRDSTAGIGTVTYYNPADSSFAGLGHAVCDVDTGEILPLLSGEAVRADLGGIQKSTKGKTGELQGSLEDTVIGSLLINRQTGVFGVLKSPMPVKESIPVAMCQQVHTGDASILCTLDSSGPHAYSIRIESVNYNAAQPTKNMTIRVTDPALIARTGGIVQGMSGSPILQDGKLAGAVTHVFINDPLKGYGIFSENMLKTSKTLEFSSASDVS